MNLLASIIGITLVIRDKILNNYRYWFYIVIYIGILILCLIIIVGTTIKNKPILLVHMTLLVSESYLFGFCVSDNYYQTKAILSFGLVGLIRVFALNDLYEDDFEIKQNILSLKKYI